VSGDGQSHGLQKEFEVGGREKVSDLRDRPRCTSMFGPIRIDTGLPRPRPVLQPFRIAAGTDNTSLQQPVPVSSSDLFSTSTAIQPRVIAPCVLDTQSGFTREGHRGREGCEMAGGDGSRSALVEVAPVGRKEPGVGSTTGAYVVGIRSGTQSEAKPSIISSVPVAIRAGTREEEKTTPAVEKQDKY
jgi:hypothetical protein